MLVLMMCSKRGYSKGYSSGNSQLSYFGKSEREAKCCCGFCVDSNDLEVETKNRGRKSYKRLARLI